MSWELPILNVFNRWSRWILSSLLLASFTTEFQWAKKPFWLLSLVFFLSWFLLETIYNWLIINALSRSLIPLFPRFQLNPNHDEWPSTKAFTSLQDWLKNQGFKKLESVKAVLGNAMAIRSSIYQNEEGSLRCQILFFPSRTSKTLVAFILSTRTKEGKIMVTDNVSLPYGGYYPKHWFIRRKPLISSLPKLLKYHRKYLREKKLNFEPWNIKASLEDLNSQQLLLEETNLQCGFLLPREFQSEYGRITVDGRYRLWKEIWLLSYFGKTIH